MQCLKIAVYYSLMTLWVDWFVLFLVGSDGVLGLQSLEAQLRPQLGLPVRSYGSPPRSCVGCLIAWWLDFRKEHFRGSIPKRRK